MAKIKWRSKQEVEEITAKEEKKKRFKGKDFNTLSRKEKDELLLILLEERGLV